MSKNTKKIKKCHLNVHKNNNTLTLHKSFKILIINKNYRKSKTVTFVFHGFQKSFNQEQKIMSKYFADFSYWMEDNYSIFDDRIEINMIDFFFHI